MAVDITKLFNEELPSSLKRNAEDARTLGAKFQINIEGTGKWFIDTTAAVPTCVEGEPGGADVTVTMKAEDFQKLHENPQANAMPLFFAQKLRVEGNQMQAMKLIRLFSYK